MSNRTTSDITQARQTLATMHPTKAVFTVRCAIHQHAQRQEIGPYRKWVEELEEKLRKIEKWCSK